MVELLSLNFVGFTGLLFFPLVPVALEQQFDLTKLDWRLAIFALLSDPSAF